MTALWVIGGIVILAVLAAGYFFGDDPDNLPGGYHSPGKHAKRRYIPDPDQQDWS